MSTYSCIRCGEPSNGEYIEFDSDIIDLCDECWSELRDWMDGQTFYIKNAGVSCGI